jgi:hypothetical protein
VHCSLQSLTDTDIYTQTQRQTDTHTDTSMGSVTHPLMGGKGDGDNEHKSSSSGLPKSVLHVRDIVQDRDVDSILEKLFHIRARGTTWQMECFCGFVQFISCMYVLPVVPAQLSRAGFDDTKTVVVTVCPAVLSCPACPVLPCPPCLPCSALSHCPVFSRLV